jgi:hypothetical protein
MIQNKPDIVTVLEREGIDLRKRGRSWWSSCPFHDEKTPSFAVNPDRQRFCCFGCGEKGDVITFIQKRHDLSFKDALAYLGIDGKTPASNVDQQREARKRQLLHNFETWRQQRYRELCFMHRFCLMKTANIRTPEDLDRAAYAYHMLPGTVHKLDLLQYGDNADLLAMYQEVSR